VKEDFRLIDYGTTKKTSETHPWSRPKAKTEGEAVFSKELT
jgi:hypothetical protein